jgi:thiamine biosynthesis protein ThiS
VRVVVNGEERSVEPGTTVAALVEQLGLRRDAVAVEVNRELVRRDDHGDRVLGEGDVVELVTLVGGG